MKIVGIIPSRYASARLPGKPLLDINGKAMIVRVYEQARHAQVLDELYVATDDARIEKVLLDAHIPVLMTSSSHTNGTSRCWEAYTKLTQSYDFVLNIQGDEPFLRPEQLTELVNYLYKHKDIDIVTLIKPTNDLSLLKKPTTVKVVVDQRGRALYFSRQLIPRVLSSAHASQPLFFKHIGMYAYRPKILAELVKLSPSVLEQAESLEQLRWLTQGYTIYTCTSQYHSLSIDTLEDLQEATKQQPQASH